MSTSLNIAIVIIFTLFIITSLLLIIYNTSNTGSIPISSLTTRGIQGYTCLNQPCTNNFTCDPTEGVCRLKNGEVCASGSKCLSTSYCSGICVDTNPSYVTGKANDPCPCADGQVCVPQQSGTTAISASKLLVCKKIEGEPCTNNNECLNNVCYLGIVCSGGLPVGSVCTQNSDCDVGNMCSLGYCQPNGITTGEAGAYCSTTPTCNAGLNCVSNKCVQAQGGLTQVCGWNGVICSHPLECLGTPTATACQFPYPNPNAGVSNEVNEPCVLNLQCSSNKCSGLGGLYQLVFNTDTSTTDPFSLIGTYTISYKLVWKRPTSDPIYRLMESWTTPGEVYIFSSTLGIIDTNGNVIVPLIFTDTLRTLVDADSRYIILNIPFSTTTVLMYYNNGTYTPFNVSNTSDAPGTQYYNGVPIIMSHISVSSKGDILVVDSSSFHTPYTYLLQHGTSTWILYSTSNSVKKPAFYNGPQSSPFQSYQNISYINGNLVNFSGASQGLVVPVDRFGSQPYNADNYSVYSDPVYGIQGGYILIAGFGVVFMGIGGVMNPIEGYTNADSLVLALQTGAFLYTPGSCQT